MAVTVELAGEAAAVAAWLRSLQPFPSCFCLHRPASLSGVLLPWIPCHAKGIATL